MKLSRILPLLLLAGCAALNGPAWQDTVYPEGILHVSPSRLLVEATCRRLGVSQLGGPVPSDWTVFGCSDVAGREAWAVLDPRVIEHERCRLRTGDVAARICPPLATPATWPG